ncbi:hypothetical protein BROUX41_005993 [Berkeleyomyces rouxiae]|uniref:uncharacterized protein n=1 Tax=Berkeleyomyces rouxiae TaxID=2035830 RepID=UPI003B8198E0
MEQKRLSLNAKKWRLIITIIVSFAFFLAELSIGLKTRSLALIADAFHYFSDVISFIVALVAVLLSSKETAPRSFSFGWVRAQVLGAFFNGAILIGLAISILVQAIQRFISIEKVQNPLMVMVVGAVGLGLNIIMIAFLHEHSHGHFTHSHNHTHGQADASNYSGKIQQTSCPSYIDGPKFEKAVSPERTSEASEAPLTDQHNHRHIEKGCFQSHGRDLGMLSVLVHVVGDAINNIGVIISGAAIWKLQDPNRYYVDPAVGVFISLMIMLTTARVAMKSGRILMETAPEGLDLQDIRHDLEKIPGIQSIPKLNVWSLDEEVVMASVHMTVADATIADFTSKAKVAGECLSAHGIHLYTLQPELDVYNKSESSRNTSGALLTSVLAVPPRVSSTCAILRTTHPAIKKSDQ